MDSNSEAYRQKKIEMTTRNLPKNFITEQSGWRSGRAECCIMTGYGMPGHQACLKTEI